MKKTQFTLLLVLTLAAIASTLGCGVGQSTTASNPTFTKLPFYSNRTVSPTTNLFLMNMDGSGVTPVPFSAGSIYAPSVSADLTTIGFESNQEVWTSNVDGSVQTQLTSANDTYAVKISPNGKKIFYNQYDSTA